MRNAWTDILWGLVAMGAIMALAVLALGGLLVWLLMVAFGG